MNIIREYNTESYVVDSEKVIEDSINGFCSVSVDVVNDIIYILEYIDSKYKD